MGHLIFLTTDLPNNCIKLAHALPVAGAFFLRQLSQKEGDRMQELIARMIACGIPRKTAICVCNQFKRKGQMRELELYVEAVERECYERLD